MRGPVELAPATATATVVASPAQALALTPDSPTVTAIGDTIEFRASGGSAPYLFSSDHPERGSIEAIGEDAALYTQLQGKNTGVRVSDANGTSISTMVYFRPQ
jgi:hypothetical protein